MSPDPQLHPDSNPTATPPTSRTAAATTRSPKRIEHARAEVAGLARVGVRRPTPMRSG